ncbi:TPA: hypothetical protein N2D10_003086 [Clostridium botulinum]|nr:hypothetical protein [Clostridium botulinum]
MVDLIITKDDKVILTRDVKKGEKITYQNDYLKRHNQTYIAEVREDLSKDTILTVGFYEEGRIVISADTDNEDCLIIKTK